jgi:hypothetical protein
MFITTGIYTVDSCPTHGIGTSANADTAAIETNAIISNFFIFLSFPKYASLKAYTYLKKPQKLLFTGTVNKMPPPATGRLTCFQTEVNCPPSHRSQSLRTVTIQRKGRTLWIVLKLLF